MSSTRPPTAIPTEIWQQILERACVDGGYTGRSLTLTSKFFHAQAFHVRFHSLALTSLAQLAGFLSFVRLRSSVVEWIYPVRHLWLSFLDEQLGQRLDDHQSSLGEENDERKRESLLMEMETRELWGAQFLSAMRELLPLVAPTTRTLVLIQHDNQLLPWFECNFPSLEELSVWGAVSAVIPSPSAIRTAPRFPLLKRLHFISMLPNPRAALFASSSWLSASPITHLRLSDINELDVDTDFGGVLARALGVPAPVVDFFAPDPSLDDPPLSDPEPLLRSENTILPRLEKLWIHGAEETPGLCGCEVAEREEVSSSMWELVRTVGRVEGMWAQLMVRGWKKDTRWEQRLRDDWVDRMEGGRGCWVGSAQEEKDLEGPDREDAAKQMHMSCI